MRTITLKDGEKIPVIGQGTWMMGQSAKTRDHEITALRLGLDLGMTLIDTAEMYGNGGAEDVVGEAIAMRRDEVFLVTKILPQNATKKGIPKALDQSLHRLGTDVIDLYLLRWESPHPLADIVETFEAMRTKGKIKRWGISNFDTPSMLDVLDLPHGKALAANQCLYNPNRRGVERKLIPLCRKTGALFMAYTPFDQGKLPRDRGAIFEIATRREISIEEVTLAWITRGDGVCAIPKSSTPENIRRNAAAAALRLTADEWAMIDRDFPVPAKDEPLETV